MRDDMTTYYNIFDAFLLTSKIEGTPISILEAMSCGVPVFSTSVGQIKNHFSHLDNVTMLSGSLAEDRSVLLEKKDSLNYCQILRDYILENHNINYISKKFFANILSNSLSFVEKDDSEIALRGEYI